MNDSVHENDDTVVQEIIIPGGEAERMDNEEWVDIKNNLQNFLWRMENEDHPTFVDEVIHDWISTNGKTFDLWYGKLRTEDPNKLISWWQATADNDHYNDKEFLQEWAIFKTNHQLNNAQ